MCQIVSGRRFLGSMTLPREKLFRQEPTGTGQHGSKKYRHSEVLAAIILWIFILAKDAQDVLWFSNIPPAFRTNF